MSFMLKTRPGLSALHCSVGLTDWDMDKELKLATTTDQFYHDDKLNDQYVVQRPSARASRRKDDFIWYDKTSDTFVKPNLWLLVNPSIACPLQCGETSAGPQRVCDLTAEMQPTRLGLAETQRKTHVSGLHGLQPEYTVRYYMMNEDISSRPAKNRRKGRTSTSWDNKTLKPGSWPRPPVNYCILIALALKSSLTGSLKVQQIYNFIREHFPFFQTAPDGWKNTIRHNLCFNSSFRKTCNQLCRDGKRKSCFWHLTLDGHRRLKDEICTLTGESFKQLQRSMAQPDAIQSLLAL
ncbi:forkhead box protein R1 [Clinocottus analis]|uniref:forkhead box protein R1 n=1 Tax=Clinocottus analis TaxID=304258 RepID=UPI0035C0BDBF